MTKGARRWAGPVLAAVVVLGGLVMACELTQEGEGMNGDALEILRAPDAAALRDELCPASDFGIRPPGSGVRVFSPQALSLAAQVGLAKWGRLNDRYAVVYNLYRRAFSTWLNETLDLAAYERRMTDSGLGFETVTADKQTFYQRYSTLGLDFIYIRNDFHVERLSAEDLSTLLDYRHDPGFADAPTVREIIVRTYPRVIRPVDTDEDVSTGFDTSGPGFPNEALVLHVSYQEPWGDQGSKTKIGDAQYLFVRDSLIPDMTTGLSAALGRPVVVYLKKAL